MPHTRLAVTPTTQALSRDLRRLAINAGLHEKREHIAKALGVTPAVVDKLPDVREWDLELALRIVDVIEMSVRVDRE